MVVDLSVDADPEFGEIRADRFVGDFGPADVRAEIAHAGDRDEVPCSLATSCDAFASMEVPGLSTKCIRKSVSWKFGRNSWPSENVVAGGNRHAARTKPNGMSPRSTPATHPDSAASANSKAALRLVLASTA